MKAAAHLVLCQHVVRVHVCRGNGTRRQFVSVLKKRKDDFPGYEKRISTKEFWEAVSPSPTVRLRSCCLGDHDASKSILEPAKVEFRWDTRRTGFFSVCYSVARESGRFFFVPAVAVSNSDSTFSASTTVSSSN